MKRLVILCTCILVSVMLAACALPEKNNNGNVSQTNITGFNPAIPGNYDSEDIAVVIAKDEANSKITFQTTYIGKRYTLYYDGATAYYDKFGQGMSLKQVKPGDIVTVRFMKEWKRLDTLSYNNDSFSVYNVDDFMLSSNNKRISIGKDVYTLADNLVVITDAGALELMDLNPVDKIEVYGLNHKIYSIVVKQGHGYLKLANDAYFIGGFIDVDGDVITQIQSDMLLAIPAGDVTVTVTNLGAVGKETISVLPGEEYELDVSKWQGEAKKGKVIFTVEPVNARVYIDGQVADISSAVELEYGVHQLIVVAEGYTTISKFVKVGAMSANLDIVMEPNGEAISNNTVPTEEEEEFVSSNAITNPEDIDDEEVDVIGPDGIVSNNSVNAVSSNETVSLTGEYKVFVEAPEGVEVYVDGNYIGIAPTSFVKSSGSKVVTLRQSGFQTRSYTITLDNSKKNETYSFSAMIPMKD